MNGFLFIKFANFFQLQNFSAHGIYSKLFIQFYEAAAFYVHTGFVTYCFMN